MATCSADEGHLPPLDADGKDHKHRQDQAGDGRQEFGEGGNGPVEEAPWPPAGDGAQQEPQQQPHDGGTGGHKQGRPGPIEKEGKLMADTKTDDQGWAKVPLTVSGDWMFKVLHRDPTKKVSDQFDLTNFVTTLVIEAR